MNRFNKILFVADDSKGVAAALKKTLELAKDIKASVTVIDVLEDPIEIFPVTEGTANMFTLHDELKEVRQKELEKLVKSAKPRNSKISVPVLLKEGKDFIEIIRTVQKDGFDLVVKACGKPHLTGVLFSSLDMSLVRKCPCAVYIMKPRKKISHSRVLAALDLRSKDKTSKNLDRTVIELANYLSSQEQGELHLLHAWHLSFEQRLKNRQGIKTTYKSVETMLRDMRKVEKAHLAEIAKEYELANSSTHLIKGDPATVIPRFAKSKRVDLLVMGTIARTGIQGFFMGNTAEKVLGTINCSILAVKPAGWKSPVK